MSFHGFGWNLNFLVDSGIFITCFVFRLHKCCFAKLDLNRYRLHWCGELPLWHTGVAWFIDGGQKGGCNPRAGFNYSRAIKEWYDGYC